MNRIRVLYAAAFLTGLVATPLGAEDAPKKVMCTLPVLKAIADELNGGAF
jgi:hypothetical protein